MLSTSRQPTAQERQPCHCHDPNLYVDLHVPVATATQHRVVSHGAWLRRITRHNQQGSSGRA